MDEWLREAGEPTTPGDRLRELMFLVNRGHGLPQEERAALRAVLLRNPALPLDLLGECLVNDLDAWFNPSVPLVLMTGHLPHFQEAARLLLAVFAPERTLSLRTLVRLWGERSFVLGRPDLEAQARQFAGRLADLFSLPWPAEVDALAHVELLREAGDPMTSPERLRAIHAKAERGVLDAVVRNPSLPLDVLHGELFLAGRSSVDVWYNPAVARLLEAEALPAYTALAYRDLRRWHDAQETLCERPIRTLPELVRAWCTRRVAPQLGNDGDHCRAFAHRLATLFRLPWDPWAP